MLPVRYLCLLAAISAAVPAAAQETAETGPGKESALTLDEAIQRGLSASPRLKAFQSARAAAQGELQQAGALRNPELSYSSQFIGASSAYKNVNPRQTFYGVSQVVETGGKVGKRERVAGSGAALADLEYQAVALDLIQDITAAYAAVIAAQESMALAAEQKKLAKEVLGSVTTRVEAAAAPLIQQSRAQVQLSVSAMALDKARRDRDSARKLLAGLMGEPQLNASLAKKSFYTLSRPESTAAAMPDTSPDLARQEQILDQSRHRLALEQAGSLPDPRIDIGVTEINAMNSRAFTVGVAVPIPVLNANRGNISRARHEVERAEQEKKQGALTLEVALEKARQWMHSAYGQASTLKSGVVPAAEKAFSLAREGYALGRFPYLEVLDAQRALFDARQQYIEALKEYHTARAGVERLTAKHLHLLPQGAGHED